MQQSPRYQAAVHVMHELPLQVWPRHGRIIVCQASVFAGVPFSVLLFKVSLPALLVSISMALPCELGISCSLLVSAPLGHLSTVHPIDAEPDSEAAR